MHNIHLDQNPATMEPQRQVSAIIFLDDQPLASGHTVFPMARIEGEAAQVEKTCQMVSAPVLKKDRAHSAVCTNPTIHLADALGVETEKLALGWNQVLTRGWYTRELYSDSPAEGGDMFRLVKRMCSAGYGVRPKKGRVVFFYNFDVHGKEAIRALHGSCYLTHDAPVKRALVKLACSGAVRDTSYWRKTEL